MMVLVVFCDWSSESIYVILANFEKKFLSNEKIILNFKSFKKYITLYI